MSDQLKAFNTVSNDPQAITATSLPGNKRGLDIMVHGLVFDPTNPNQVTRNSSETISALKCVYAVSSNNIAVASSNSQLMATVLGVAVTASQLNESTQVLTYGTLRDSSFSWGAGTALFVSANGSLTNIMPPTGFRTRVATANGPGEIFINIQETITL